MIEGRRPLNLLARPGDISPVLDLDLDVFRLREDDDGRGRRVDPSLRLGLRHALHPVHARFVPQQTVRTVPLDGDIIATARDVGVCLGDT